MKRFLFLLAGVGVLFVAANFFTVFLFHHFLHYEPQYLTYLKPFSTLRGSYDLLITGDSHALAAWRNLKSPSVANLAFGADNELDIQRKIAFLNRHGIRSKIHLFETDAHVVSSYREKANNNDLSVNLESAASPLRLRLLVYMPYVFDPRIKPDIEVLFKRVLKKVFNQPGKLVNGEKKDEDAQFLGRANEQFLSGRVSEVFTRQLEENVAVIKGSGAELVFILYPLQQNYLDLIGDSPLYHNAHEFVKRLAGKEGARILDYTKAVCRDSNFINQDHLRHGRLFFQAAVLEALKGSGDQEPQCLDENPPLNLEFLVAPP